MSIIALTAAIRRLLPETSGSAAVEYAIIAGGIALAIIVTVASVGEALNSNFEQTNAAVESAQ
jgi:Flp pilus assembly pilin Flp